MVPLIFDEVLVETAPDRLRAAALVDGRLVDWMDESRRSAFAPGSIVLGRVAGAAPDLDAVFVDIGAGRPAILDARRDPPAPGDAVTVQIVEAPAGDKGGRVTRRLTLIGQQAVLLPGGKGIAASRRLEHTHAERLVAALGSAVPTGHGVLLRWTAGRCGAAAIAAEIALLAARWDEIAAAQTKATAPAMLFDDGDGLARILRTLGAHGEPDFVFADRATLRAAEVLSARWFPALAGHLSAGEAELHDRHDVASIVASAGEVEVRLPSGGRIAIEPTRACTTIDVDSAAASANPQSRAQTNLEAAREIARQLWLRDIGGMVIVDFIRMDAPAERRRLLDTFSALVSSDRVPVQIAGWTPSGLMELVRQRARGGAAAT